MSIQESISKFEMEAVDLERKEHELLLQLQATQQNELKAFRRFEDAMVDSSKPRTARQGSFGLT